jgi:dimethylamine monooxygenase subunit A
MAKAFDRAPAAVIQRADALIAKYHKELKVAEVTIDYLFVTNDGEGPGDRSAPSTCALAWPMVTCRECDREEVPSVGFGKRDNVAVLGSGVRHPPEIDRPSAFRSIIVGISMLAMTLAELFPDADYRFPLNIGKGDAADFFAPTGENAAVLAERRHWLNSAPETYGLLWPEGAALLGEMIGVVRSWGKIALSPSINAGAPSLATCLTLGAALEPDFVLLCRDPGGIFRVVGGALCFPSHWSLPEKAGLPLEAVHNVVPGLNPAIGPPIHRILEKLRPDTPLFRSNWGVQWGEERNDHPSRRLPRLAAETPLDQVRIRVEHQALVSLPQTGGILFGIRVIHHPLNEFTTDSALARGLRRALETMPEGLLRYKGLAAIRPALLRHLARA